MTYWQKTLALMAVALMPATVLAQDVAPKIDSGNTAWMLVATALVLLMTLPGLALFYGGLVRKINVLNTLMQCFAIACVVTFIWIIAGYSISFYGGMDGVVPGYLGSMERFMLQGMTVHSVHPLAPSIPESVFMMYQMTFAIITPALIVGAIVERIKFSSMMAFMALWSILVYTPIAHMVWGGGVLGVKGVLDYAGGTVVHISAGIAALVMCLMLGRRQGWRHDAAGFEPHNLALSVIGASLLWVGWFGFNAGSALAADGRAGMAMTATHLATASAAIFWMCCEWAAKGRPTTFGMITGAVAGLVAITPGAGFVDTKGALIIGALAGVFCFYASTYLKAALKYDDSLDVFGVHGIGGILGSVLVGVFAVKAVGGTAGMIEGNTAQLWIQVQSVLIVMAWSAVGTWLIAKAVDIVMGLRASPADERVGLDKALHGEMIN
ncbi:MAG: ammonium transporter [Proteobacteria bacterium]|nr:ammonium transporter [Pseudomonadota bacterium]NBX86046.1 ammonium transporter [Pseudomonadota bacterium]